MRFHCVKFYLTIGKTGSFPPLFGLSRKIPFFVLPTADYALIQLQFGFTVSS